MVKLNYLFSVFSLFVSFLLYNNNDDKISIISSCIYTIGLFFCVQIVVVMGLSYFHFGGNLVYYSLVYYFFSGILLFISIENKEIQKYYLDKKEVLLFGIVFPYY